MTVSIAKLVDMLTMQSALNERIAPNWRTAYFPWNRAILAEVAEAQEHLGWKWWAKTTPNVAAARLELVDLWHFIMSAYLAASPSRSVHEVAATLQTDWALAENYAHYLRTDLMRALDWIAGEAGFEITRASSFANALQAAGMSFDELHRLYIGKNVLNAFRQANGYKQGTYSKVWADGREDNEHLNDLLDQGVRAEDLHAQLAMRYEPA